MAKPKPTKEQKAAQGRFVATDDDVTITPPKPKKKA